MTYEEIKRRLSKCEKTLELFKKKNLSNASSAERQQAQKDMTLLNERILTYKNLLLKEEKTYILTPKSGKPTAASLGDDEVDALKDADDIEAIKAADGEEIKEQDGINFSLEETKAIAKKVGKAVAIALKAMGDAVTSMKAIRLEENSFEIKVLYKNGSDDEFSFYISEDTLHLQDFSFDKELVDVGVKPSGEAIVHVDHLANELQKHFKSLSEDVNEVTYNYYTTPKHFDICPGAEALRDKLIDGGKSPEELGEWTYRHDQLFKLEKDVLKSKYANIKHVNAAEKLRAEIIHLSRDLGIDADDVAYLKGHVQKIQDVRMDVSNEVVNDKDTEDLKQLSKDLKGSSQAHLDQKKKLDKLINTEGEGDDHHYIKVPRRDYKKAMSILNNAAEPSFVKIDVVDDDGAGNVIIYFMFNEFADDFDVEEREAFMYDAVMDLQAQGLDISDHSAELDEAQSHPVMVQQRIAHAKKAKEKEKEKKDEALDHNDPVLMRARVAKMRADDMKKLDALKKANRGSSRKEEKARELVRKLKIKRAEIEREMENDPDIEPQGGPVADMYGDQLNKIDNAIEKAASVYNKPMDYDTAVGLRENQPTVFDDESFDALRDIILKYVEDPDAAEKLVQQVDDHGLDSLPNDLEAQLERDPEFEAWYHKLHYGSDADTDYMQRRRAEKDYMSESTDLYDRNGIQITRFSGGDRGLMVQINYGGKYIHVPADEFAILARAMQSVIGDVRDMTLQMPRKNYPKGMREGVAKIQKAHGLVVAKMKELAKQYKAGDSSVVYQLKDLTAKKKALEISLDKAVAGTNRGQELTESPDQDEAVMDLRNIADEIEEKADEAREIVRQYFPNELSRLDGYGVFNMIYSDNRYNVTLGKFIDGLEDGDYDDLDDDNYVDEGMDDKPSFKPKKLKKLKLGGKTYEVGDFDPNDDGRIMSIEKYPNGYFIQGGVYSDYGDGDAPKEGYGYAIDLKGNEMDEEDLEGMYEGKYKSDAQRKAIYAAKAEKNEALQLVHVYDKDGKMYGTGSVEKVEGDKTTVRFDGSTVKRFPSDRVKPVKEELKEGATCCGRCGRVHVKGSGCKRPYLKGKSHCRNK